MPITNWESRHESSYPSDFRTRYRTLSDAIYDDYDNRSLSNITAPLNNKDLFRGLAISAEGYAAWLANNLTGGNAPLGGNSWENPYSFNFSPSDRGSLVRALGCRADRDSACNTYSGNYTGEGAYSPSEGVKHTIFGLALCSSDVRNQYNGQEPFVWNPDGSLKIYDRYNFTDLQDFSRAPGGNPLESAVKALIVNIFGQATGGLTGILVNSGIPDAVNSWFNAVHTNPNYNASPFLEWRADGVTMCIQEIRRLNGTVYVTTCSPHGLTNTDGAGVKIVAPNDDFNIPDDNQFGLPNGVDINITGANTFAYNDPSPSLPNRTVTNPQNITAVQKKRWGKSRHMFTMDTISATDLRTYNPELYFDALGRGLIPYVAVPGSIEVGQKQPNPTIAGIAGLTPSAPISVNVDLSNISNIGFSQGTYSAPFNSWSQNIVNATYHLGPYAKINKFVFQLASGLSVCFDDEDYKEKNKGVYGLYGRLITIPEGLYAGELGFILQDWYNFDDTPYNTNNGQAPPNGTAFPSKSKWWNSTIKSTIYAHFMHLSDRPLCKVQAAYSGPQFESPSYYRGTDLGNTADYTVELITVLVAAAAISGIAF